ncbi:hypothetical protein MKX03_023519 [Papaver bracteatum]|nr:hypothetical protein MKX03_023519 [Papaver bracteatum]
MGFEITKEFGRHGAYVAIMGRRKSVLDSPEIGFVGDDRKNEDATRVVNATFQHFGRIRNSFMEIDIVGTFIMCHEALKYIKKGGPGRDDTYGGGTILNISATLHYS